MNGREMPFVAEAACGVGGKNEPTSTDSPTPVVYLIS